MDSNDLQDGRIDRAAEVIGQYLPMFEALNERGVDYCVVGGLAVLLHSVENEIGRYRLTQDADVMVGHDYPNDEFAKDYLLTYASDPASSESVYYALFGDGGIKSLSEPESRFANISFVGADMELDGVDTPDFDIARSLSMKDIESITPVVIEYGGVPIRVASVEDLLEMKQATIELLRTPANETPRPQDFEDIKTLRMLEDASAADAHGHEHEREEGEIEHDRGIGRWRR